MEELPQGIFLKFKPNQLESVRRLYNLDKPGRMKEAVDLLCDWIKKQEHFRKKELPRDYLERLLIITKGSVEQAKVRLDKSCTLRSLWPEFFDTPDINSFSKYNDVFCSPLLPEMTDDFYRVKLFKVYPNKQLPADGLLMYIKFSTIIVDYMYKNDYPDGFMFVLDIRDVNMMDVLSIANPVQVSQMLTYLLGAYGMRMKGIHFITTSKLSDAFVSLIKQFLSKKVGDRIQVHRSINTLYNFIPKKILPVDYGGNAPPLTELRDEMFKELGSKEHVEYMKEMYTASTDESKRPVNAYNDIYLNMTGTFRTLNVD